MSKTNTTKTNKKFTDIYTVLLETPQNKNLLTMKLNSIGVIATMHSRKRDDITTIAINDMYYQLVSESRILLNAKKTKFQLWLTDDDKKLMIDNKIVSETDLVTCNDSTRHYKTGMTFTFDDKTFNKVLSVFAKNHAIYFSDIAIETK